MDSRVVTIPVHRKSDLKKIMGSIEEAGSAVILHPLKSKDAELVLEKYYFNELMSSVDYPDSSQIYSLQRDGEAVLLTSIGKINKASVLNITSAYISSGKTKTFFIPVELPFERCFGSKSVYLLAGKEVTDISQYQSESIKDSLLLNGDVYCITESGKVICSPSEKISFREIDVVEANSISADEKGNLIFGCRGGILSANKAGGDNIAKLTACQGSNVFEAGFADGYLIVVEDKTVVKSFSYDKGSWTQVAEYSSAEKSKLSIQGNSTFFGGLLMVQSDNNDVIDKVNFLTVPDLKILKHSRHAQN